MWLFGIVEKCVVEKLLYFNPGRVGRQSSPYRGRVGLGRDADIFDVDDEKLISAMCNWSNHCLLHLLPSERDTRQRS